MVTLTCAEARALIFDYLDGELDAPTARAIERHRDRCQNCPSVVAAILAVLTRLRTVPEPAPTEQLAARLQAIPLIPPDPPSPSTRHPEGG